MYIDDLVVAIERAVESPYSGVLNLAGDTVVSVRELAERLGRLLERTPVFESSGEASADRIGDNSLMKRVLGEWNMMSLDNGLARALNEEEARA